MLLTVGEQVCLTSVGVFQVMVLSYRSIYVYSEDMQQLPEVLPLQFALKSHGDIPIKSSSSWKSWKQHSEIRLHAENGHCPENFDYKGTYLPTYLSLGKENQFTKLL